MQTPPPLQALDAESVALAGDLDALNVAIKDVESALRTRAFKTRTTTPIPAQEGEAERHFLCWSMRDPTGWALYVFTRADKVDERVTPLLRAPWIFRVRATECFDALLVQATIDLRKQRRDVEIAIQRCHNFVAKISEADSSTVSKTEP